MKHSAAPVALSSSGSAPLSAVRAWARGLVLQTDDGSAGVVYFGAGSADSSSHGFRIPAGGDMFAPPVHPNAFIELHNLHARLSTGTGALTWFAAEYTENPPPGY
jgi:hypothetical protein